MNPLSHVLLTKEMALFVLEHMKMVVLYIDYHSKIVIKNKGISKYPEIFVGLLKEKFQIEKNINEESALDNFISRQVRIIEIHEQYGDEA